MLKDFKTFVLRGNVIDMAVGIIIGLAFAKIVTSLVNDVIMPPIGLLLGRVDFANLFINLSNKSVASVAEAKAAGIPTINYGVGVNAVIEFLIVAFVLFMLLRAIAFMTGTAPNASGEPNETMKDNLKDDMKEESKAQPSGASE